MTEEQIFKARFPEYRRVTMFEKKAEEYCLKRTGYGRDEFHGRELRQAFKDGAEFGYNKANEWHNYSERPVKKINALCFDIKQNKFILGFYDLEADEWLRYGGYETIYIDLWKEIVLPKESE